MRSVMKRMLSVPFLALVLGAALLLSVPGAVAQMRENTIICDGSTTVGPIAKAFAEYYQSRNPGVNITISETGSGNGAKSLINNACDVANMSRPMKDKEFEQAVEKGIMPIAHVVAMDGIAVIVHESNRVDALSIEQVRGIYTGKITNWRQLGGASQEIVKISRDTASGTYETFEKLVMNKEQIKGAEYVQSNGAARAAVRTTPAAIGYVGLGFLEGVKALTIDGVNPSPRTVVTGAYPVSRPLFMWTNGYPELGSHVHRFVTLHLTRDGQQIVEEVGFVPVTDY